MMNSIWFYITFNFIISSLSIYTAYLALKRYYKEPVNFENIFYWGISFILLSVEHSVANTSLLITDDKRIVLGILFRTLSLWFQLTAILFSTSCNHSCLIEYKTCNAGTCKRKHSRTFSFATLIFTLTILVYCIYTTDTSDVNIIHSLLGFKGYDLAISFTHLVLALLALFSLSSIQGYYIIKYSFLLIIVAITLRLFNIYLYDYNLVNKVSISLMESEKGFVGMYIFSLMYRINKIAKT